VQEVVGIGKELWQRLEGKEGELGAERLQGGVGQFGARNGRARPIKTPNAIGEWRSRVAGETAWRYTSVALTCEAEAVPLVESGSSAYPGLFEGG
jgi:hypothetical protein